MKTFYLSVAVLGLAVFNPACGGGNDVTADGGQDSSSGGDSSNGGDSPSGGDSASGGDASDGGGQPLKANYGSVSFSETKQQNTSFYTATAGFFATPDGGLSSGACAGTQSGSCCYLPSASSTTGPTAVSAGGLTAKDGASTIATMSPNGATYTAVSNPPTSALTWTPGDTLSVSAAGNTVHPFSGSVTAAALFAGVNPAIGITPVVVTKASDFTLTWTAATGDIVLVLSATSGASITCTSSTDSGTMTVPHALLQNFTSATGTISLSRTISADASPDNANVTLRSSTAESGTTTFQ